MKTIINIIAVFFSLALVASAQSGWENIRKDQNYYPGAQLLFGGTDTGIGETSTNGNAYPVNLPVAGNLVVYGTFVPSGPVATGSSSVTQFGGGTPFTFMISGSGSMVSGTLAIVNPLISSTSVLLHTRQTVLGVSGTTTRVVETTGTAFIISSATSELSVYGYRITGP